MPITEIEMNELLVSVANREEKDIASAVFGIEGVLREIISLIASHPEKLQNIGGPIKAIEKVPPNEGPSNDPSDLQVYNVEVSVVPNLQPQPESPNNETVWMETSQDNEQHTNLEHNQPITVGESQLAADAVNLIESSEMIQSDPAATLSIPVENRPRIAEATTIYTCPHCDREFVRVFELQRHITVRHTDEKKFQCDICGQRFALKLYLNNHLRSKHLPDHEKPYGCPHCDYRCIIKSMLTRHMEKHVSEKRYKCPVCPQSFYSEKHLERHSYRHKEKNLRCQFCEYKTADPFRLRGHLKIHTSTDIFKCTQCEYTTNTKGDLNRHMTSHSDETFSCPQCPLVFKKAGNLKRHLYVHSEKNLECDKCSWRTADPYEFKRHQREHDEGKKHICPTCGFKFIRQYDLKKHMKTHEKIYACKHCPSVFVNAHELSCHKRRRHIKSSSATLSDDGQQTSNDGTSANCTAEFTSNQQDMNELTATGGQHQTVIIGDSGEQIIISPGVHLLSHDGTPLITGGDVDQQLLEMASVIISQVDESGQS